MVTTLFTGNTKTFICKQLDRLPSVVSDWQQSCKQPQCPHYCDGKCCNPGRQSVSVSAPCPFDGKELPLVDAEATYFVDDDFLQSLPKKGLTYTADELANPEKRENNILLSTGPDNKQEWTEDF